MKKMFLILTAMIMTIAVNAQQWERQEVKGDELIGTTDGIKWRYQDGNFVFAFIEGESSWKIGFNGKDAFKSGKKTRVDADTHATIGFYNEEGELVKKVDDCILKLTTLNHVGEPRKDGHGVIEYLRSEKGYVRIVTPLYLSGNFDLKLPCILNDKE